MINPLRHWGEGSTRIMEIVSHGEATVEGKSGKLCTISELQWRTRNAGRPDQAHNAIVPTSIYTGSSSIVALGKDNRRWNFEIKPCLLFKVPGCRMWMESSFWVSAHDIPKAFADRHLTLTIDGGLWYSSRKRDTHVFNTTISTTKKFILLLMVFA